MINSNINRYITTIAKLQKTIGEQGETMKTLYKVMVLGGGLTISTMVMPVMAEDIATNQFVIPTTMPPLEPRIENPTFTVTDAPDAVVSSVKNGWAGIGYHFVIRKDGTIERGRPLSVVGAHAQGDNLHTIGICMARNFEKEYVGLSNIMHL